MLWKIEVVSTQGGVLSLQLENPTNGFVVSGIEGLDPVKATLVSTSFAQLNGGEYQSSRREERNIKFKIEMKPNDTVNETVRTLRKRLYQFFMPESDIWLRFYMRDDPSVWIRARVESFESQLFTDDPVVDISTICFDPDFFNPEAVLFEGTSTTGTTDSIINYDGTLETGYVFNLSLDRSIDEFTLYHRTPDNQLRIMEFAGLLYSGDSFSISTVPGRKSVYRNGTVPMLYGISPQSSWLELKPGENKFRMVTEGDPLSYVIQYTNKYGGL